MSIRIGSNLPPIYNAPRVDQAQDVNKASQIDRSESTGRQDARANVGQQYVSQEHGGVVQTRVSDANSFKKAQLDGNRDYIEKMADRLYDKLPNILADMKSLPSGTDGQAAPSRVAVTERNAAAVADRQAVAQEQQLANFSL